MTEPSRHAAPSGTLPHAGSRRRRIVRLLAGLVCCASWGAAAGDALRVAVLNNSPPMSYQDADGRLTGFNVDLARALCEAIAARCELVVLSLDQVVDAVAAGQVDFAAVSLLDTPERRRKVLLTKPYYRSTSIWFARPGVEPGAAGIAVAVVEGGVQIRYARARQWTVVPVARHGEIADLLAAGRADAALLPMVTSIALRRDARIERLGLATTVLRDPELSGDVCYAVNPREPELRRRLDAAIDELKRNGRFDRINTEYLPFRLQ